MLKSFGDKKFCSWCGDGLAKKSGVQKTCQGCNISEFNNPKVASIVLIYNGEGEVLCATRAQDPGAGKLDLPGGFVDSQESAEQAATRELEEELSLKVAGSDLQILFTHPNLYPYDGIGLWTVDTYFGLKLPKSAELKANDDVAKIEWVKAKNLDLKNFYSDYVAKGIAKALKELDLV